MSLERTLGSIDSASDVFLPNIPNEHNAWLQSLTPIRQLIYTVKRYYRAEWGENWREHFTVDRLNRFPRLPG